ncbi:MAG: cyclase family protein [Pseudomonadota bacterium]
MASKDTRQRSVSIARVLDFSGEQSRYFGVAPATASPLTVGDFVGDTRRGGSCNTVTITMNPHCHGTHTECIGHILDRRLDAIDVIPLDKLRATVVSVPDMQAARCEETLTAATEPGDRVLSLAALRKAVGRRKLRDALIIRTRPNPANKRTKHYDQSADYPFLTRSAIEWIVEQDVTHLLIDTPSVDRMEDEGHLEAHRVFWQLPPDVRQLTRSSRRHATITEMIFVPNTITDGHYRLALQPAPFSGDATPSNPTLFYRQ